MANQKGDTVSKGHYFNVCTDETNKTFETRYFHTDGEDVEFNDGDDAETKVGAIKGITSDLNTTTEGYAADMTTVAKINSSLGGLKFGTDGDGNYGYYGADGSLIPFRSAPKLVKYKYIELPAKYGYYTIDGLTIGKKYILFLHRYGPENARPTSGCTIITTYGEGPVGSYSSSGVYLVIVTNTTITCPNYKYASGNFPIGASYCVFEV